MNAFRSSVFRPALLLAAAAALGACSVGPDFVRPAPPDAGRYTREPLAPATLAADGQAQHFTPDTLLMADWWRLFKSAQLDAVVRQAIANNPTLQAAEASLRQSQDNLRAGYGVFYPHIDAGLGAVPGAYCAASAGAPGTRHDLQSADISGTVSYALDVFGGERRTVEGLRAQADYQRYASVAANLTLSANVVDTVIARSAYEAEVRASEQLIELERQQLALAEAQVRAGTVPYSTVLGIRSLIAADQALLAPLRQRIGQSEDLLATLEGVVPSRVILPDIELAGPRIAGRPAAEPAVRPGSPASRHPVGRGATARGQRQNRRRDRRHVSQLQPERHLWRRRCQPRPSFGGQRQVLERRPVGHDSRVSGRQPVVRPEGGHRRLSAVAGQLPADGAGRHSSRSRMP